MTLPKRVDVDIQEGFLRRAGWMGRWVTAYRHRYSGAAEKSGRDHNHPWALAVSIVLTGGYSEWVNCEPKTRKAFSVHWYKNSDHHRLGRVSPGTLTVFVGLCRKQSVGPCYRTMTPYGAAHYSEMGDVRSENVPAERD